MLEGGRGKDGRQVVVAKGKGGREMVKVVKVAERITGNG